LLDRLAEVAGLETPVLHFIIWIVVSGFAGFVASKIMNRTGSGLLTDILLGIVGGFVGGFIVSHLPIFNRLMGHGGVGGLIVEAVVAILGALLVIYVWRLVFSRRRS
jgi:uncharacterized membrane protein YeaQ/YmgE (transglycosylase-associated protein family)